MSKWSDILPALKSLFTTVSVDRALSTTNFSAEWKEGQRSATHDKQRFSLLMKVTTVAGIGDDELRREYVPLTDPDPAAGEINYRGSLKTTQWGLRRITLQVQAHCTDRTDSVWAHAVLERVRAGLRRQTSLDALQVVNVGLVDILQATKANYKDDGRWVSAAVMDVILSAALDDTDPTPQGWIEAIEATSHLKIGDAEISQQMTAEVIPDTFTPP